MSDINNSEGGSIEGRGNCPSCKTALVGEYCHACGEKKPEPHDLTLKHFLSHALHEVTHIENSKILRTFSALAFKPGKLTEDYLAGRRKLYITPIRIWLVLFAIVLFLYTFYKPVAVYDVRFIFHQDKSGRLEKKLRDYTAKKQVDFDAHIDKINKRLQTFITYSRALDLVIFTMFLWLAFISLRRRIPEHLIFTIHYASFMLLLSVLMWPINLLFLKYFNITPWPTTITVIVISSFYLYVGMRKIYGQKSILTALKAIYLTVAYIVATQTLLVVSITAAIITAGWW